jgi:hypothetical protein
MADASESKALREFIYLDTERVRSLAAQLQLEGGAVGNGRIEHERLLMQIEPALLGRAGAMKLDSSFDFAGGWTRERFADGQIIQASGAVRLFDFGWLSMALSGLPAVLKKMSKLEMEALRNSDEGRRMSKSQLQQRSQENQVAIARVEEFKADELGDVCRKLYGQIVRVKIRPNAEHPQCVLVGSASADHFYDSPAALSQKYGIEIDAGWSVLGQLNISREAGAPMQPIPTGNRMEDSFEQIAILMNNAFRMANAPAFPALSFTPVAIYRALA